MFLIAAIRRTSRTGDSICFIGIIMIMCHCMHAAIIVVNKQFIESVDSFAAMQLGRSVESTAIC